MVQIAAGFAGPLQLRAGENGTLRRSAEILSVSSMIFRPGRKATSACVDSRLNFCFSFSPGFEFVSFHDDAGVRILIA